MLKKLTVLSAVIFLILILGLAADVSRAGAAMEIEVVEPDKLELIPGAAPTISLRIINNSQHSLSLQDELTGPGGINLLTPLLQQTLDPDQTVINLVKLHISRHMEAGTYLLNYQLAAKEIKAEKEIPLTVLSRPQLKVFSRQAPAKVIAGQVYYVDFMLQNTGNTELETSLNISDNLGYAVDLSAPEVNLRPGETEIITALVQTDEDINKELIHRLKLEVTAATPEEQTLTERTPTRVNILPVVSGSDDLYFRLPVTAGIDYIFGDKWEAQLEITASGHLNAEKTQGVDFTVQTPALDISGDKFTGGSGAYKFSWWNEDKVVNIGDQRFSLSRLTEYRLRGRGIEIRSQESDNLKLGTYYRRSQDGQDEGWSLYMDYMFGNSEFSAGYLDHTGSDGREQLLTLGGEFKIRGGNDLRLEYAEGLGVNTGRAYRADLGGSYHSFNYDWSYLYAEPDFAGRISDRKSYNIELGYPLIQQLYLFGLKTTLYLTGSFIHRKENLASQQQVQQDEVTLKGEYRWSNHLFRLMYSRRLEEAETDKKIDFWEGQIRQSVGDFNWRAVYKRTWSEDLLSENTEIEDELRLRGSYHPGAGQSYSGNYSLRANEQNIRHQGSLEANFALADNLELGFDYAHWYEKENDELTGIQNTSRDRFKTSFTQNFPKNRAEMTVEGQYTRREDKDDDFSLKFVYSRDLEFGLPVDKKPVGRIAGRVYDADLSAEPGLENIIVRINDLTAVTDEQGYFKFPELEPGSYHLQVERANLEPGRIVASKMPLEFSIEAEKEKKLKLGIIDKVGISGRAVVYEPLRNNNNFNNNSSSSTDQSAEKPENNSVILNQGQELESDYGLSGLLLILRNKDNGETKVEYTAAEGKFNFSSLRPGSWELIVNDNGRLPEHHRLEKDRYHFELTSGESKELEIKIIPRQRELEFIDEGEVLNSNHKSDD